MLEQYCTVIHTAQISKWRKLKSLNWNYFDITVKSGLKEVAPDWDFLMEYKNSAKDSAAEARYTERYLAKLEKLWIDNPQYFNRFWSDTEVLLVCYCPAGKFCHRHILAKWLIDKGRTLGKNISLGKELLN